MKIGCCGGDTYFWSLIEESGFDFIEVPVEFVINETNGFSQLRAFVQKSRIRAEACNCFIPSSLKVAGPEADLQKLNKYVDSVFGKVKEVGCEIIVFGSGGSRTPPEGFPIDQAILQIKNFLNSISESADKHGITVVVEPLHHIHTPLINTVKTAREICGSINKKPIKYLADLFHMAEEKEPFENLNPIENLYHVHIPFPEERFDVKRFIGILKNFGYNKRISIEDHTGISAKIRDLKGNQKEFFDNTLKQIKELSD